MSQNLPAPTETDPQTSSNITRADGRKLTVNVIELYSEWRIKTVSQRHRPLITRTGQNWQSTPWLNLFVLAETDTHRNLLGLTDQNWQSTSSNFNYSHWSKLTVNAIELIRTGRNWQTPSSNFTRTDQTWRVNVIKIYSYWPKDYSTSSNSFTRIDQHWQSTSPNFTTRTDRNNSQRYGTVPALTKPNSQRYRILAKTVSAIKLTSWV